MKLILLFIFFATKLTAQDSLIISGIEAPLPSFSKKFNIEDVQASTDKNDPSTIKINIKGEAKNISFPIKLPFKAEATNPSNSKPLSQEEPSAAVAIEDKDGGVYEVDDKGKTRKIGNKGSELPPTEYKEAARKMNIRLGRATTPKLLFKALASEPLAFDEWQENFKGKSIIEKEYQKIGENYYVPIKLIPAGMTGKVQVDLNGINKDSLIFKTPNGSVYTLQENNILSIAGAKNGDGIELYAQNKFDSTIVYGKLNIYSYEIKNLKVNLVPVNSTDTIYKEKLETELNKIYYPYGVSVKINVESAIMDSSWDINGDNKLAIGETKLMSRYTDEMSYLNSLYEGVDNQTVTLFYLPQGGSDASVFGDMPIKSQYGYLFKNGLNAETIAHELLHGYFQLNHTFDNSIGLAEGSSENLMDYPVKNKLYKYQWDLVHDRGLKLFSFLQDTSAGRLGIQIIKCLSSATIDVAMNYAFKWLELNFLDKDLNNNFSFTDFGNIWSSMNKGEVFTSASISCATSLLPISTKKQKLITIATATFGAGATAMVGNIVEQYNALPNTQNFGDKIKNIDWGEAFKKAGIQAFISGIATAITVYSIDHPQFKNFTSKVQNLGYDKVKIILKKTGFGDETIESFCKKFGVKGSGKLLVKSWDESVKAVDDLLKLQINKLKRGYPDAKMGYRGSLSTGKKYSTGGPFDPTDWDVDAFIVSDKLASKIGNSKTFRNGRQITDIEIIADELEMFFKNISGYRTKVDKPFTFRIWTQAEFDRIVKPNGYKLFE